MAARPATRRPSPTPMAPAPRPPVRDFMGGAPYTIEWDIRTAYDLLFSLSGDAGSTEDLPAGDRTWLTEARASLPQELQPSVTRLFDTEMGIHTLPMIVGRPEVKTSAQFLQIIRKATPAEVMRAIVSNINDGRDLDALLERLERGDTSRSGIGLHRDHRRARALAEEVRDDRGARRRHARARLRAARRRPPDDVPAGSDRAHDRRYPLAARSRRPASHPRAVLFHAPVQLHLRRA